ncbi:hypothetical protein CLOSTMETH_03841 [[Clostridium] methylpentosum DSM 5476]|uniref:Uncharacterized protein n=1 Tax=[Clostridium] methylpentosum DSM 5476 TaxID=537013 RepID=C0EIZ5_9FIRM|nr:hypothetical protein CLOSTMETH_03841 [[Clostridium] methylpentosum DSM 5476]
MLHSCLFLLSFLLYHRIFLFILKRSFSIDKNQAQIFAPGFLKRDLVVEKNKVSEND